MANLLGASTERKWPAQPLLAVEVVEKEGQEVAVGMGPVEKPSQLPFQGRLLKLGPART